LKAIYINTLFSENTMKHSLPNKTTAILLLGSALACSPTEKEENQSRVQWTEQQAADWYSDLPPLIGFNYAPRTAVNQLEMWQAETWDPQTIDEELGWAEDIGFNTARVFLHDLVWEQEPDQFIDRIDEFLDIASSHDIRIMFVFFDGVWNPIPTAGPQPEPIPGIHNSQWVQSPGVDILGDPSRHEEMEPYVRAVVSAFRDDDRVLIWDLFNEPDNPNLISYASTDLDVETKRDRALELLELASQWAMEENPVQPLTAGVWDGDWSDPEDITALDAFMLQNLDINSFHSYSDESIVAGQISDLQQYGRPLLCTEYMARPMNSTFESILPLFAAENVGGYNWGFVNGRIQTIYSWTSWIFPDESEPDLWFHDILHSDGTPYDQTDIDSIKEFLEQ
jgi:hypothetical protein